MGTPISQVKSEMEAIRGAVALAEFLDKQMHGEPQDDVTSLRDAIDKYEVVLDQHPDCVMMSDLPLSARLRLHGIAYEEGHEGVSRDCILAAEVIEDYQKLQGSDLFDDRLGGAEF